MFHLIYFSLHSSTLSSPLLQCNLLNEVMMMMTMMMTMMAMMVMMMMVMMFLMFMLRLSN